MSTVETTRGLLSAYADKESWNREHDQAQLCLEVEEKLAWGIWIFQGLLDFEARIQSHALKRPGPEMNRLLDVIPTFYQRWVEESAFYLEQARQLQAAGGDVEGVEAFEATLEEARCLIGNLKLEDEIRPIEELIGLARGESDPFCQARSISP